MKEIEPPLFQVLIHVEAQAEEGEDIFEVFQECAIREALIAEGNQKDAAKRLGVSERRMSFMCRKYKLQEKQRRKADNLTTFRKPKPKAHDKRTSKASPTKAS